MAVLPIQPTPFFANKNRAFWYLQIGGWGGAFLLRAISAFANEQPLDFLVIILIQAVTGFSLSLVLSVIYRQLISRRPLVTWSSTALALALAVGIHAFIDSWVLDLARPSGGETDFVRLFVGIYFYDLTVLGAWSALYYAINYFLQVEEQADRLERLEMQATSAQLEMLRYQLNPHFLFNTLNSISTLVLLKQTEPANAMLTRLSSFLRHTLVNQPGSKVTMAQEVETLMLYLDIERMRFEERLQTDFQVDPVAARACIPSMLLQPLVENAIKYGVSPQEEGATISLVAQIVGPRLRVTVSDTGPGINQGGAEELPPALIGSLRRSTSTGVGLANIRNRLAQAYGDDHRFEIRSPDSGGFTVLIEIPYEPAESAADETGAFPPQPRQMGDGPSVAGLPLPERA
ncbi:histidine kinase [Qipengyuania sp. DY56-A-20]|uniref:Histidine kinase n=1 Tax=Qipengyuania benthica TaxID=3067651 RepID=A0ABT9H4I4_9SPHN|nr:histidine kinase [Qipengyuania sp. DY56-A-20]MDP4538133.1 histidine kinase [Qipengyuania sp. DY56-A-20]